MAVMVALLRGINVGGRASLPMADLRRVAAELGYEDPRTYIQSGNLLVRTAAPAATIAADLAHGVAALGGVAPAVIVRSADQLREVVSSSPFLPAADPGHLHVVFTDAEGTAPIGLEDLEQYEPERVVAVGPDLHLLLPGGVGRSRLAADLVRRGDAAQGTMRNWRTVTKLLELIEDMEDHA